jgi:hypothetical protein
LHKFAVGELGWTLERYYFSSPYEFFVASEGYFDKVDRIGEMVRNVTYTLYCSNTKKEQQISIQEWHPMFKDSEADRKEVPSWAETPKEKRLEILKSFGIK